jgi:glycosyltransferase involved in cell wall biosynthesis
MTDMPKIFIALLVKQKELVLPLFLRSIDNLDYPKDRIHIYIRTNNNTDNTELLLEEWMAKNANLYAGMMYDNAPVESAVQNYGIHEWNGERFRVLGKIRQESLRQCLETDSDYYFVVDIDNFVFPETLRELVKLELPIVAPLMRYAVADEEHEDTDAYRLVMGPDRCRYYANYHYVVDDYGSVIPDTVYYHLLYQKEGYRGVFGVQCVHCTYLIKREYIEKLSYLEESDRWEYMVFSSSARSQGVTQYLDTRRIYGVLTLTENNRMCEYLYDELMDPETREEKYQKYNPSDLDVGVGPGLNSVV